MSDALVHDGKALEAALQADGDDLQLTLSRETAAWLAQLVAERLRGKVVVVTNRSHEVSPAEAALILGVSRPQVRKLMDEGKLGYRMVGRHHRIPLASIEAFREWERSQMKLGMEDISNLQNEMGLFD